MPTRPDRIRGALNREFGPITPRRIVANAMMALLPDEAFPRVRRSLVRLAGYGGVHRSVTFAGRPRLLGPASHRTRLRIGESVFVNVGCLFDVNDDIEIGDRVAVGHDVAFLTDTHRIGGGTARADVRRSAPIRIEAGCWIGARATILPGVTIGSGTIVGAGSVVTRDLPPHVMAAGVPARVVRELAV